MLINGWTIEKAIEAINTHNDGTKAQHGGGCVYETPTGNHCAVGCFIAYLGLDMPVYLGCPVSSLGDAILTKMPLPAHELRDFQAIHDGATDYNDIREVLVAWLVMHERIVED